VPAAIYARVSTEDQGKGYSIPTQIEACQRLARQEGYTVSDSHIVVDEGSGTTLERPGLCTLRELIHTTRIAAIIVYDPDRLSRNLGHQLLLAEESEKAGIKLLIVSHPLEQGPEGWLFFQMRGALAEYERAKILERTKRGTVGRIRAGHPWGGAAPLGYRRIVEPHAGRWEIDEQEAALVRRIFSMCLSGMATRAIARVLTLERIPTPVDRDPKRTGVTKRWPVGVWAHQTVRGILRNEAYAGQASWGKRENLTKTVRRYRPHSEWLSFAVPPIVDAATFEAAQQSLSRHKAIATRNRKHEYLFVSGRLKCGRCGRSTTGICRKSGFRYYICNSHFQSMDPALRCSGSLRADVAETQVWEAIVELLEHPEIITAEVAKQQASAEEQREAVRQELAHTEAELVKCDRAQQRWNDAYEAEIISLEELKVYRADLAASRQSLLLLKAERQTKLEAIGQAAERVESLFEYCARVRQELKTFTMAEKRRACEALDIAVQWVPGKPLAIQGSIPLDSIVTSPAGCRWPPAPPAGRFAGAAEPGSHFRTARSIRCRIPAAT
jgi:site-specific DNA recombinase